MQPGMRLGEALSLCPDLALVEQDPATAEHEWEQLLKRLEDSGFAVEAAAVGCVYFETRGIERLYGGLEPALKRALAAVGAAWDARIGAAERRFAALAAALGPEWTPAVADAWRLAYNLTVEAMTVVGTDDDAGSALSP